VSIKRPCYQKDRGETGCSIKKMGRVGGRKGEGAFKKEMN
jgi:hypothetical protein